MANSTLPHLHFDIELAKRYVSQYMALRDAHNPETNAALGDALENIRPLVRLIVPRYISGADAEDAEQDVLMHIANVLPTFNRNEKSLNAWLVTIIRNQAISIWRSRLTDPDTVPLDDDHPADSDEDSDESIEATVAQYTKLLNMWLGVRFPSIPKRRMRKVAELLASHLLDNVTIKKTKAALVGELGDILRMNQINSIYDSTLVFMRAISWNPAYVPDTVPAPEFSLIPELQLLVGEKHSRILYSLFRGCLLRFRVKPNP